MKKIVVYILLFLVFIAASWSLFRPEFFRVHDYTSGARIAEMTRALLDGHFPVRWTQNFGYGYGMPLFEFYGPLPYYVGSIFYWLSGHLVGSIKFLYLLANIGTVIGAYLLGKEWSDRSGGVLAAAAITLAPYRALNLFVRGALNETWGLMALPWIFWSLTKLIKGQTKYWFSLTMACLVLLLSHNLTVLISAPFIIAYLVINWFALKEKTNYQAKLSSIKSLIWGGIVAMLIGAFYWLPSFFEKHLTKMKQLILTGYFDFRLHFLYVRQFFDSKWGFGGSSWGPDDNISFFLGYGQLLILLLLVVAIVFRFIKSLKEQKLWIETFEKILLPLNIGLLFVLATVLTTPKTRFLWDNISLMRYIQFPWRFMLVMVVLLGLMAALVSKHLPKKLKPYVTFVLLSLMSFNAQYFRPETYLEDASDYYYSDPDKIRKQMSNILPDYIPQTLADSIEPSSQLFNQQSKKATVLVDRTHQKLFEVNFEQNRSINVNLANYPGWTAYIDQNQIETRTSKKGLISIKIPKGKHLVSLVFKPTRIRLLADVLSLIGLLLLALTTINTKRFEKLITNDQ